jgi:uncharacterized protein DUF5343
MPLRIGYAGYADNLIWQECLFLPCFGDKVCRSNGLRTGEDMSEDSIEGFKAPYVSFTMLQNILERMRVETVPARVDRGWLGSASGTTKAQFLAAVRALQLVDNDLHPTETLHALVENRERAPEIMREILTRFYGPIIALGTNATQQQLAEAFREEYGISGSTVRKAEAFYLAAARFAGVPLSPHFNAPRASSGSTGGTAKRRRTARVDPPPATQAADPMNDLRTKYVETLLDKFASSNGEVDADLADRIERLVGFNAPKDPSSGA